MFFMKFKEKLSYDKPPLKISEQISLLQERRLTIDNISQCSKYLTYVGYYRLSGYMIPFYDKSEPPHVFKNDTNFSDIIEHYEFDRQLRLICLDAIERIEVAFRSTISDFMSLTTKSAHWLEKNELFKNQEYHQDLLEKLHKAVGKKGEYKGNSRSKQEKFIDHYHEKYSHPNLPPSWMIFETLNFGDVSFLFKNLQNHYKKNISRYFGQDDTILGSWMHALCYLRNLCAHHSRVWNREMSIVPKIAKLHKDIQLSGGNKLFFGQAIIIKLILDKIDPTNKWHIELGKLTHSFPMIDIRQMGFTGNTSKLFQIEI